MERFTGVNSIFERPMLDEVRAKVRSGKYDTEMKDKSEWVKIDDPKVTPPLVPQELWDMAHEGLKSRDKNRGLSKRHAKLVPYLLRGLIHCSECGIKMYPMSEKRIYRGGRTETVRMYRCSAKLGGKREAVPCSCGRVFAEEVEACVWDKVVSFFRQP